MRSRRRGRGGGGGGGMGGKEYVVKWIVKEAEEGYVKKAEGN